MLPELPAANATTPAPATAIPSTSAWLFLLGMLTCLLLVGHQLPFAQAPQPTQRVAALPARRQVAEPTSNRKYVATSTVAGSTAAL